MTDRAMSDRAMTDSTMTDRAMTDSTTQADRMLHLSADSPAALAALLNVPDEELLATATLPGAEAGGCRLGIVAPNAKRLGLARKLVASGKAWRGRNDIWFSPRPLLSGAGGIAFLFPGLEAEFAPQVDDVAEWLGVAAPVSDLDSVGHHAAGVIAVSRMLDDALRRLDIRPAALAGHSIGEWTAMLGGNMMGHTSTTELFSRIDLDAILVRGFDFGVLGCPVKRVVEALASRPELVISHENSTNQTVVCGPADTVADLVADFRARGVICQTLPFQSGFHTPMLRRNMAHFEAEIVTLPMSAADVPVWSATIAAPFPTDPAAIRELYVRHLLEPVRFRELTLAMYDAGIRVFVQVGPGQLGSLVDDTLRDHEHLTVAANSPHRPGLDQLRRLATAVWVEGGRPDFLALEPGGRPRPIAITALAPAAEPAPELDLPADQVDLPASALAMTQLDELGERFPLAAELSAFMREVADSVSAVLRASKTPAPSTRPVRAQSARSVSAQPAPTERVLQVSTAAMPYLLDHCFAPQRPDWPDETDRRPVVPATTMIQHMIDAAERTAPGRRAIGLDDVRLHRWLVAAPPQDVVVRTEPVDASRVRVNLGEHADAVVLLGEEYERPTTGEWPIEPGERPTALTAHDMYEQRWMFHGPQFQGITKSIGIWERGVRAELTVLDAPGALLDAVGQVFGQWLAEMEVNRPIAFPARINRIRFHGPQPPTGTAMGCAVRIREVKHELIEMDAQLTLAGRPMVSISGWQDVRLDSDQPAGAVNRFTQLSTLSERRSGGWWLIADRWPGLASREFYMYKYLAAEERAEYFACPPRERRHWLLRRFVVKDAVRGWLWDDGAGPLFPAEIAVRDQGPGRFAVSGRYGLRVPPLSVAVAECQEVAVAMVRPADQGDIPNRIHVAEVVPGVDVDRAAVAAFDLGTTHRRWVRAELVSNPDGLPSRQYVVAWTVGTTQETQEEGTR